MSIYLYQWNWCAFIITITRHMAEKQKSCYSLVSMFTLTFLKLLFVALHKEHEIACLNVLFYYRYIDEAEKEIIQVAQARQALQVIIVTKIYFENNMLLEIYQIT